MLSVLLYHCRDHTMLNIGV